MKNFLLLLIVLLISNISFATKHTHYDEYEIRYIKSDMKLNNSTQNNLRNQYPWKTFNSIYSDWFTYFNEYNYKPHRAFGSPIDLTNGNTTDQRLLNFIDSELSVFNIPQAIVLDRKTENDKYINYDFKQFYNNLEVINSRLYAKLNLNNQLIAFGLDVFYDISISINPLIS